MAPTFANGKICYLEMPATDWGVHPYAYHLDLRTDPQRSNLQTCKRFSLLYHPSERGPENREFQERALTIRN